MKKKAKFISSNFISNQNQKYNNSNNIKSTTNSINRVQKVNDNISNHFIKRFHKNDKLKFHQISSSSNFSNLNSNTVSSYSIPYNYILDDLLKYLENKVKKPKTATTKDGKQIEIIEDDEPSEIIIDKKTGKKVKKKKIRNEDGDIEELKEIVEDIPTEYDEETGEKLPKKKKYINNKGKVIELLVEPSEEEPSEETKKPKIKKKEKKPKKMITSNGKKVQCLIQNNSKVKMKVIIN